jgi:hypothetical protein
MTIAPVAGCRGRPSGGGRNQYVRPLLGEATTFNFFNEIFTSGLLLYTAAISV